MLINLGKTFILTLLPSLLIVSLTEVSYADDDTAAATYTAIGAYNSIRKSNEDKVIYIQSTKKRKDGVGAPEKNFGTGFLLTEEGHVLTASHVVLQADADTMVETTGRFGSAKTPPFELEFIKRDRDADAVLLQFPNTLRKLHGVTIGDSKRVPEDVPLYVLGFPVPLFNLNAGTGILSSKYGPQGRWVTSIPLNRGNSGGPIFDIKGHVIAIAIAGADEAQAITYAIPISHVNGLIDMVAINASSLRVNFTNNRKEASQTFAFYQAVGHEKETISDETFCLPRNYRVTEFVEQIATQNGPETKMVSLARATKSSNCVVMTAQVKGLGVEKIGPITTEYKGRGWIGGNLLVRGEKVK
jgi:S1-C subfamily serine protease